MRYIALIIMMGCYLLVIGQEHHSYVSDKKFRSSDDLVGYTFKPSKLEIPETDETDGEKDNIYPGDVVFSISPNYLYIRDDNGERAYSINSINPVDYGYKLRLMNARDPSIQGHLKVIILPTGYVQALIFKATQKSVETIYYLPDIRKELEAAETAYFTDKNELILAEDSTIWGLACQPFFRLGDQQKRIYAYDSLSIGFVEKVIIIDKNKNKRTADSTNTVQDSIMMATDTLSVQETRKQRKRKKKKYKKPKIKRFYYMTLRAFQEDADGDAEEVLIDYEIKSVKEYFNKNARQHPYEIEITFKNKQAGKATLYLTQKRGVNMIDLDGFRYIMRGN